MSIKISIITPSIRPAGVELVDTALARQTFKNFEWLICGPLGAAELFNKNIEYSKHKYLGNPPLKEGMYWDLNFSYNRLIKESAGELIISWQDYTFADADALEKFWFHYQNEPKTLVSAVGNKYREVYPERKEQLWQDPRERNDLGMFYSVYPQDIEWNLCSVPKQALYDIGGFDEGLDFVGFGMDGYQVNHRLDDLGGYDFKIAQDIKSYSLVHGRVENWDKHNVLGPKYEQRVTELKQSGKWPVLDFLKTSSKNSNL